MNKNIITILSGIPCSGKSTWANKQKQPILSRDQIRLDLFGRGYKQNNIDEQKINIEFWKIFDMFINSKTNFIIDNTNCRKKYINEIEKRIIFNSDYITKIKYFECPLYIAYIRNIIRYFKTGKWIPFKVIKNMEFNYKKMRENE